MTAPAALYLDTSAVLRAILESGTTLDIDESACAMRRVCDALLVATNLSGRS